jgi:hypothetical protein
MKLEDYHKEKVLKCKSNNFILNKIYVPKLYDGNTSYSYEDVTTIIKNNNGILHLRIYEFDVSKEPPDVIVIPDIYIPAFNFTQKDYDDYHKNDINIHYQNECMAYKKIISILKSYPLLRHDFDHYKFILEVYEYSFHFIERNIIVSVMSISELISWMYERKRDDDDN